MRYLATRKSNAPWNEMDNMVKALMGENNPSYHGKPAVDIREEKDGYYIEAEFPGFNQDQIEVKTEDNLLTIMASRKEDVESKEVKYLTRERHSKDFKRSFVIPRNVDQKNIKASYENGLLILQLTKKEEAKAQTISINTK